MSFEIYAQRFLHGTAATVDRDEALSTLGAHLVGDELVAGDGSRAKLLGLDDDAISGLCFSRPGEGEILELIVDVARRLGLVLMWPSVTPTFGLTTPDQADDVPEPDWRAVVVRSGPELADLIRDS